ncbi:MAG TPA: CPBP family intramembrane metalloprotease [Leptospiraceae bacterium]|nr:CPBP family intramembrane metalloprotease [Leptospiraceae bacterium]HMX35507.1 CPBP family intramembrane metalloprotease [Leptospiraceae bacterium]HMY29589.1 CPBP family intramembrane metalloprotease [Leptospiraceae bacterium]HMZ62921.1 CPBP family intramembrane metalloprotease [Leptospiraceae bacterium]HNA05972.1 CPBP family intramembrane metalloprotease [Leptospiraceae bacterium]
MIRKINPMSFFFGILFGFGLQIFTFSFIWAFAKIEINKINSPEVIIPSVMAALLAAVLEEFIFRRFIYRSVLSRYGWKIAVSASALVFGILHTFNDHVSFFSILSIMVQAGILLPVLYTYTNSLPFVIGLHFAWNLIQMAIFGTPTSGTKSFGSLFEIKLLGNELITGGNFGVEASIQASFICLVLFLGIINSKKFREHAKHTGKWSLK